MAIDTKYGEVTTEKGEIRDDEPVFVLRGQDKLAVGTIAAYQEKVEAEVQSGAITEEDGAQLLEAVKSARRQFVEWADANPTLVKLPD